MSYFGFWEVPVCHLDPIPFYVPSHFLTIIIPGIGSKSLQLSRVFLSRRMQASTALVQLGWPSAGFCGLAGTQKATTIHRSSTYTRTFAIFSGSGI